jgi:ribosome biogenesis GTPase A
VVANKTDLAVHKVSTQSGEDFARSHGVPFVADSVRTGNGIDKILPTLIREYRKKNPRTHFSAPKERKLNNRDIQSFFAAVHTNKTLLYCILINSE